MQSESRATDRGVRKVASSLPENASSATRAEAFTAALSRQLVEVPGGRAAIEAAAPVVCSGMASSSIGWRELPYAKAPFALDGSQVQCRWLDLQVAGCPLRALLVSGLATDTEMMRGEETQLIGLQAQNPSALWTRNGLVVLPGTHSKHVRVQDGHITAFRTYLTGELFDVLSAHTVLRFTTDTAESSVDESSFREGVCAARRPGFMRSLFQARTRAVLQGQPAAANRAFLNGLLLGAELVDLVPTDAAVQMLLAASGSLRRFYRSAADELGLGTRLQLVETHELEQAAVYGHAALLARISHDVSLSRSSHRENRTSQSAL